MEVLIIPDSFKGSLTAVEVSRLMEKSVKAVFPQSNCCVMPFSDGGEGALTVLQMHCKGSLVMCTTNDALFRQIEAPYFLFHNKKEAWIELSQTAGLTQLKNTELQPLETSSWGTGKMIEHALENGCEKIYLGLGGSATQDLGTGIMAALGGRFLDQNGKELPPGGGALRHLKKIELSKLNPKANHAQWILACDVENPLLGKNGTAHTYAKQKGASAEAIVLLEQGGIQFAKIVETQFGIKIKNLKGGGAAGGVSAGLYPLLNTRLTGGFELLAQLTGLKDTLSKFDLILTGEGTFDKQSLQGKLPIQVASLAKKLSIPTRILAGRSNITSLENFPHCKIISTTPDGSSLKFAIQNAANNLQTALLKELKLIKSKRL